MKIINSIMQLLKNEAFNGVSAVIAILLILISPEYRVVLGILGVLLFVLVVVGHFWGTMQSPTRNQTTRTFQKSFSTNFLDLTKSALPIVSAIVVCTIIIVFMATLFDKGSNLHATFFGGWAAEIQVPSRETPIPLLTIAPNGLIHDVFEKSEPFITFKNNGDITLTFEWTASNTDYPSGILIEHAGQDNENIIFEPSGNLVSSLDSGNNFEFTQFPIHQNDTLFLKLEDSSYVRLHFTNFIADVYGNIKSLQVYVSYLVNGNSHFEGLTQP